MAEVLVKFDESITAPNGARYFAQAVGREVEGGLWEGWLEFLPVSEDDTTLESGRETTQPNRTNTEYWAQGLTKVYLEGALGRAISLAAPKVAAFEEPSEESRFTEPAARRSAPPRVRTTRKPHAILNPFEVYLQGEEILRSELNALSRDHLESIASAYDLASVTPLSDVRSESNRELIEMIVQEVRATQLGERSATTEGSAEI